MAGVPGRGGRWRGRGGRGIRWQAALLAGGAAGLRSERAPRPCPALSPATRSTAPVKTRHLPYHTVPHRTVPQVYNAYYHGFTTLRDLDPISDMQRNDHFVKLLRRLVDEHCERRGTQGGVGGGVSVGGGTMVVVVGHWWWWGMARGWLGGRGTWLPRLLPRLLRRCRRRAFLSCPDGAPSTPAVLAVPRCAALQPPCWMPWPRACARCAASPLWASSCRQAGAGRARAGSGPAGGVLAGGADA